MPRRIVERRIHQDDVDAVGRKPRGGKNIGAGCNVHRDDFGRDSIRRGIAARERRQRRVDLDQNDLDSGHALCHGEAGRADAGAEIDDAVAGRAGVAAASSIAS